MPRLDLIQLRGGTAAAWADVNPVLAEREPGIETDTGLSKFGDGVTPWNLLLYSGAATACFIGSGTGDTSGDQFPLTFVADPDREPVDWAWAEGGQIVLPGPVIAGSMLYRLGGRLDFTGAVGFSTADTSPDTDVTILFSRDGGPFEINAGGPYYAVPVGTPGVVFDVDAVEMGFTEETRCAANVELRILGTINAFGFDAVGGPVTDGVVSGSVALWIVRAVLPDLPVLP